MTKVLECTPIDDELTRLPLPVLMQGTDFSLNGENFHHHFHPERSENLGYDPIATDMFQADDQLRLEGQAVRACRGQGIPIWLHSRYHNIFGGPPLPESTKDKFTTVVLACSGIVPRQAIDLYTRGEHSIVELSDRQHEFIRRRVFFQGAAGTLRRSKRGTIGDFLASYTINNSLPEVVTEKEVRRRVREFLKPASEEERLDAGRFILTHAVDASVADLIPIHLAAQKERLVRHSTRSLGDVVLKFFSEDRFSDYFDTLESQVRLLA